MTGVLFEERPWGGFMILDSGIGFQTKRVFVNPGKRTSYHVHARRYESWVVVAGRGKVTINGEVFLVTVGNKVDVPIGTPHRAECFGADPLMIIEVQMGSYFGEDDNDRLEDDFGRVKLTLDTHGIHS